MVCPARCPTERTRGGDSEAARRERLALSAGEGVVDGSEEAEMSIESEVPRCERLSGRNRATRLRQYERTASGTAFVGTDGTEWGSRSEGVVAERPSGGEMGDDISENEAPRWGTESRRTWTIKLRQYSLTAIEVVRKVDSSATVIPYQSTSEPGSWSVTESASVIGNVIGAGGAGSQYISVDVVSNGDRGAPRRRMTKLCT